MITFLILFVLLLLFAYLTNYFLIRSFLGYKWRIFVAPGVIIHELSHALACVLMFAKVAKISFFDKDGGSVTHKKSPIPILGPIIISTAPLVIGIVLFYYLGTMIHLESSLDISTMFFNVKSIIHSVDFSNWENIVIIYLLLSIAVTMTPSWKDLVNMLFPLIILSAVIYLLYRFTAINFLGYEYMVLTLVPIVNLAVFILIFCLVLSFILFLLSKIIFKK